MVLQGAGGRNGSPVSPARGIPVGGVPGDSARMGLPNRRCPNCGDTHQDFRPLDDAEKAYARGQVPRADLGTYRRCARAGCVRVQSYFDWQSGFDLPDSFRPPGS